MTDAAEALGIMDPKDLWPSLEEARDAALDLVLTESELQALKEHADREVWVYEQMLISNITDDQRARCEWLRDAMRLRARQLRELEAAIGKIVDEYKKET